ncbi:MAG: DNA translocase FtsK 4TM domain-containing protein [Campylobacterales bacterium]|nr:DNA translocase FtsK 4TM domain-containing protein [Campylobacterales bacterium]
MRDALLILLLATLFYLALATVLGTSGLIGAYGSAFAAMNHKLFGYLSYIYLFAMMIPLIYWYRSHSISLRSVEVLISCLLLFFALLIFQAMVVENDYRGVVGAGFVDFLSPYIGLFGVSVFWVSATLVSIVMISDRTIAQMAVALRRMFAFQEIAPSVVPDVAERYSVFDDEDAQMPRFEEPLARTPGETKPKAQESQPLLPTAQDQEDEAPTQSVSSADMAAKNTIVALSKKLKESKQAIVIDELEENTKLLEQIDKGKTEQPKNFKLPKLDFLQTPPKQRSAVDEAELDDKIKELIEKLAHFKIEGDVVRTYAGPVVSTFEFKPAANIKVSKILGLQDDLAMALKAETIRIQAPIPGKDVVGIEIPNHTVETIYLRDIFESKLFKEAGSPLTIALGKDIVGKPFITDLKKLPHLLIAGTTGSGKSVGINAMILSLLYRNSPDQLRLLMIDPKMLEFSIYNDIPHLLTPVITKAKQAIVALNNMVHEMERRYAMMSDTRTKNIENYNEKAKKEGFDPFPYIVVIIDELADLMMTSGKDVEYSIARLAQMARASGIHLIVATQRPSVDVVTGLIKANLPSRISYKVGQRIDSKIILDQQGAESLLGRGDMLFTPPGASGLVRLHAPWSSEPEIERIVDFIKEQREPQYDKRFLYEESELSQMGSNADGIDEPLDELFEEAKSIVLAEKKTSISYLQRRLQIGYNRSARIIEQLEQQGILSAPNNKGNRDIV